MSKKTKKPIRTSASAARAEGAQRTRRALADARKVVAANLKAIAAADREHSKKRDERDASADGLTASERAMEPQEHEVPSAKERANDVNLRAFARSKGKGSPGSRPTETAKPPKAPKAKRLSALDAAAQVLAGAKEPMTAGALIDAMAKRDLWKSPGGKTPHATLYAAMIREIRGKGKDARFRKTDRGLFTAMNGKAA